MAEVGVPDAVANTFFGLVAPADMPTRIVNKLNDVLNEGMRSPEIQQLISNVGSESNPNSPEEFATYIAAQHRKWLEVGKAAGVKID
jgi:tripartite-type tricarboxylate transporter receptor subunit TctC